MPAWTVELREDCVDGWSWEHFDSVNKFVCKSRRNFRTRWQAIRDHDNQIEDHQAVMHCRIR